MAHREKPSHIRIDLSKCDFCGACIAVCPPNVMTMVQDVLKIDFDGCTYCSLCIDICPVRAIEGECNPVHADTDNT